MARSSGNFIAAAEYQPLLRELGLDGEAVFDDPRIVVWRDLPDRQNCTLDEQLADGQKVRLHIKRYPARHASAAEQEARGIELLHEAAIETVPLVGWGRLQDGRGFLITADLSGFAPADKRVEAGLAFDRILGPTARLAARLHSSGLHHRDMYLCHFFVGEDGESLRIRLIDAARVRRLPRLLARRWIVKDLAQFWYSTLALDVTDHQRERWLDEYSGARGSSSDRLKGSILRKVTAIGRHDARLRKLQPGRNISIP